jgi:hypothetical protein
MSRKVSHELFFDISVLKNMLVQRTLKFVLHSANVYDLLFVQMLRQLASNLFGQVLTSAYDVKNFSWL